MSSRESDEIRQLRATFQQLGFVCLRGFLNKAELKELETETEDFISTIVPTMPREMVFYDDLNERRSLKQIQRLFDYSPYFHQLMFHSRCQSLACHLLNDDVKGVNMQYFDKPPGTSRPTPPHQDGYYFMLQPNEALTMWLAIDSADSENGCVRYLPGSNLGKLRNHQPTDTLGFSQGIVPYNKIDQAEETVIEVLPGDLLAHHALTIHRADANHSDNRSRRAIGLIYYSVRARELPGKENRRQKLFQTWNRQGKI